jgi:hypothetical protein
VKVYAVHTSGKRLFYPTEDALKSSLVPRSEIAAITIDQDGKTYPEGTFYLLGRNGLPKAGWHRVEDLPKNAENGPNSKVFSHNLPADAQTEGREG